MLEKSKCTGCGLCKFVCPYDAIKVIDDDLGHHIFQIDETLCKHCGACERICPSLRNVNFNGFQRYYFVTEAKCLNGLDNCSSGGFATLLSKQFIQNGGVVIGAAWDGNIVRHIVIEDISELDCLKGSKYVQSDFCKMYSEIRKRIKYQKVLVFGTPCQIDAARIAANFSANLFTVDLICHGIGSMKLLSEELYNNNCNNITDIFFRDKHRYVLRAYNNEKEVFSQTSNSNPYFSLYLSNVIFRDSCYQCRYAASTRVGDITIGDNNLNKNSFSNSVVVNNQKGEQLFNLVSSYLNYSEKEIDMLIKSNPRFSVGTSCPPKRTPFIKNYKRFGLKKGLYKTYKFAKIKTFLRTLLKREIQ